MLLKSRLLSFILVSCTLSSCEFHCSVGKTDETPKKTIEDPKPVVQEGAAIYNHIEAKADHLQLKEAFLVDGNGDHIPSDNKVDLNGNIKLVLLIGDGWTVNNDTVLLGASEKVTTDEGRVMMEENDLFSSMPRGVSAKDAKIIGISVNFRNSTGPLPPWLDVAFRVWDKKGEGSITGSYKLYPK